MKSKEFAWVSLSSNSDMISYFDAKLRHLPTESSVAVTSNEVADQIDLNCSNTLIACKRGQNKIGRSLLQDLMSVVLTSIKLGKMKVKYIIFDNEHFWNPMISIITKLFGARSYYSIHDVRPHEGKMKTPFTIYNYFVRNFIANGFIVFSKESERQIGRYGPTIRIKLAGMKPIYSDEVRDTVLWFGRIEPYKGMKNLPEIIYKLKSKLPTLKVVIAGKGNDPALESLATDECVKLINRFVSDNELDTLLKRSFVTILPYDSATQSGVIIRSYASGVPIVCYDVGSLGEYVIHGETGFCVKHNDSEKFADSVIQCLQKSEEMKLAVNAFYVENYSERQVVPVQIERIVEFCRQSDVK